MKHLKKFCPDNYNALSIEERITLIKEFANEIFKKLNLQPIPIVFDELGDEKTTGGVFMKGSPTFICINSFFVDYEFAEGKFRKDLNLNIFLPYFLVATISHECYHYYQYELINKLVKGEELTSKQKDKAYLYFISLYEKVFATYCEDKDLLEKDDLSRETIYTFSPCEISSNEFADDIVTELALVDDLHNYLYYSLFIGLMNCDKEKDLYDKVVMHDLNTALTFLSYKNANSGLKAKYLDINEEDLKQSIIRQLKNKTKKLDGNEKLLKKISKK